MSDNSFVRPGQGPVGAVALQETEKTKEPARYRVLMFDDDFTPMDFVEHLLAKFFHMPAEQATRTMLEVHHAGVALCGVYHYEIAETKVSEATAYARARDYPLRMTLERE